MFTISKLAVVRDLAFRWRTVTAGGAALLSVVGFATGLLVAPALV